MNTKSLQHFLYRNRLLIIVTVSVFIFLVVSVQFANAQESDGGTISGYVGKALATIFYGIALAIGGLVTGIGGLLLDLSISKVVVNFGEIFASTNGIGTGVNELWKVIRDVLNILFIFGLIYIGIKTILNSEDSGTRRTLGLLIVAALMINFSLYITQAIVDFSNIAAVQVFQQIVITGDTGSAGTTELGEGSVTGAFLNVANITSFFGGSGVLEGLTGGQVITLSIFMMITLIITGIVFAMGAVLLIARFIALTLYMIFSPIMFLGFILPALASKQQEWWQGFLKQAFFAPAFLFMLYLSLVVLQRLIGILSPSSEGFTTVVTGNKMTVDSFTIVLFFAMMIGFLYASIKVAQMMGIAGANTALKIGGSIRGAAQGFAYRKPVGWGLNKVTSGIDAANRVSEDEKSGTFKRIGAGALRAITFGESGRKGIESASNYGAGGRGRATAEKDEKARTDRAATGNTAIATRRAITAGTQPQASHAQKIAMENVLARASTSDFVKMAESDAGFSALENAVGSFTDKKFESLMESKELTPKQKAKLGAARTKAVRSNITESGGDNLQSGIKGASADELNALEFNELMDNALYVQSGQIDKLESKWGEEKMRIFKETRKQKILDTFSSGPLGVQKVLDTRKGEKEIAKLPTDVFKGELLTNFINYTTSPNASVKLSGGLLQQIATDSGLSGSEKRNMGEAIRIAFGENVPADIGSFLRSGMGASFN